MTDIILTQEQKNIISCVSGGNESLVANAGPGSAKTYTNVESMKNSGFGYKTALAYNKNIADELRIKAPPGVEVKTTHSTGLQMCKSRFRSRVNAKSPWTKASKTYQIIQQTFPSKFAQDFGAISNLLVTGMDARGFGADLDGPGYTPTDWMELVADLPVENDLKKQIAERMPQALTKTMLLTEEITFAEMLLMPLHYELEPQLKMNRLWGDEIQDWSHIQLRLASKLCDDRTLVYGFGDKFQSIYAFRGADIHAVDNFENHFDCTKFPLTRSFRCPEAVIELARRRNPDLTVPDGTKYGTVAKWEGKIKPSDTDDDTMIICRLNSPLFSLGMKFLVADTPLRIKSALPNTIKGIIKSFKTQDLKVFQTRLDLWYKEQVEFAGDNEQMLGSANDKYGAITALMIKASNVDDLIVNIDKLTRGSSGPMFTTVHGAKGLEAEKVFLLKSERLVFPGDDNPFRPLSDDEKEQEWNIWFVAITRSKNKLYFA